MRKVLVYSIGEGKLLKPERVNTMTIKNLTPHAISFVCDDGSIIATVQPSGIVARVSTKTVCTGAVQIGDETFIPTTATRYGQVENLPEPEDGTVYIVSSLVAQRVPGRADVFIPNESVRDEHGRIIGCKSLGHI